MPSELEREIHQHLIKYMSGVISLADFEDWFVPTLWDLDQEDERTRALAGTVHILISEYSRGDRTIELLREGLTEAIRIADKTQYPEPSLRH
jgi:hypothetical protein